MFLNKQSGFSRVSGSLGQDQAGSSPCATALMITLPSAHLSSLPSRAAHPSTGQNDPYYDGLDIWLPATSLLKSGAPDSLPPPSHPLSWVVSRAFSACSREGPRGAELLCLGRAGVRLLLVFPCWVRALPWRSQLCLNLTPVPMLWGCG